MADYRPIGDNWWLARAKLKGGVKYYGAYPGGFLHRARALLGVQITDPVLHVCGGMAKLYPYDGFGPNDATLDLDPACQPDFLQDAREPYPIENKHGCRIRAVMADGPYSEQDAAKYTPGPAVYPSPNLLLKRGLECVEVGGRVGILHYVPPKPPRAMAVKFVAAVSVWVGFNNRVRAFTVFERLGA